MSRIGRRAVPIPKGVDVRLEENVLFVKGPKGQLSSPVHPEVKLSTADDMLTVTVSESSRKVKALHGLYGAITANMVKGVTEGYQKVLEIVGVGYKVELRDRTAVFSLGYSHPIHYPLPEGIDAAVEKNKITLRGTDKELLGRTAAIIRGFRPPEPYKGKGIKYADETIKRKAGKAGGK